MYWLILIALLVFVAIATLIKYVNHLDDQLARDYEEDMRALVMHSEEFSDDQVNSIE